MKHKYLAPQFYKIGDRVLLINAELKNGHSFKEIGDMFGGVGEGAIKYHYKRYILMIKPKKTKKKKKAREKLAIWVITSKGNPVTYGETYRITKSPLENWVRDDVFYTARSRKAAISLFRWKNGMIPFSYFMKRGFSVKKVMV